ncbi:hypothetical protein THAOC_11209, partial [Thalassiosira oceanica]
MIANSKSLQHLRALEAALAGTLAGGIINGRGRITLEDGKTLVFRDGHFELLTDEDVDGDARALGIGELETLTTTELVVTRGKYKGRPAQVLGNNGKGQIEASGSRWAPPGCAAARASALHKQPTRNPEVALPGNILARLSRAKALSLIEAARLPPLAAPPVAPQPEEEVVEPAEAPEEAPEPPAGGEDEDVHFDGGGEFDSTTRSRTTQFRQRKEGEPSVKGGVRHHGIVGVESSSCNEAGQVGHDLPAPHPPARSQHYSPNMLGPRSIAASPNLFWNVPPDNRFDQPTTVIKTLVLFVMFVVLSSDLPFLLFDDFTET